MSILDAIRSGEDELVEFIKGSILNDNEFKIVSDYQKIVHSDSVKEALSNNVMFIATEAKALRSQQINGLIKNSASTLLVKAFKLLNPEEEYGFLKLIVDTGAYQKDYKSFVKLIGGMNDKVREVELFNLLDSTGKSDYVYYKKLNISKMEDVDFILMFNEMTGNKKQYFFSYNDFLKSYEDNFANDENRERLSKLHSYVSTTVIFSSYFSGSSDPFHPSKHRIAFESKLIERYFEDRFDEIVQEMMMRSHIKEYLDTDILKGTNVADRLKEALSIEKSTSMECKALRI